MPVPDRAAARLRVRATLPAGRRALEERRCRSCARSGRQHLVACFHPGSDEPMIDERRPRPRGRGPRQALPRRRAPARRRRRRCTPSTASRLPIGRGEMLGLVGESGSGKSTVAALRRAARRADRRDDPPQRHRHHAPLAARDAAAAGAQLHIVFQDPYSSLNPRMTMRPDRRRAAAAASASRAGASVEPRVIAELFDRSGCGPSCASAIRTSSRAGSASGSASRGRSRSSRRCSSPTSRCRRSTSRCRRRS